MKKTRQNGFTLLELMFTVAIAAVVIGIGVPNMRDLIRNSRIAAETNDLVIGFHAGRSEAVKRRSTVTLCASSDAAAEAPTCGASFYDGWVVFVDRNGNGAVDLDADPELSDAVIEAHGQMRTGVTMTSDSNYFAFAPSGFGRDLSGMGTRTTNVLVCDYRGNDDLGDGRSAARLLAISSTGRPQIFKTVADVDNLSGGCP